MNIVAQPQPAFNCSAEPSTARSVQASQRSMPDAKKITALQLGLGWFPESPGGLERFYFELVKALPAVGVETFGGVVGTTMAANNTDGRICALASPGSSLPARLLSARAAVRELVRRHRPDLVVSHFALYTFPALGSLKGKPLVVHFQGPWAQESHAEGAGRLSCLGKRLLEQAVYRRANRLICLSSAFGDILAGSYGISRDRIRIVPGAIDVDRFDIAETRDNARQKLGWPTDRPIVFCVRRLVRRMGLENLIDAAALLRTQRPDALILIAGRGAMTEVLRSRIKDTGLQNSVRLLGFVPDSDLPSAYRAANLTIVPSVSLEGFGLVAAESLAAGTPAMVTPVGGLPDVVSGLGNQWVLPGTSASELSDGMAAFLNGRIQGCSPLACADYARRHFSWQVIAAQVRTVYEEALET